MAVSEIASWRKVLLDSGTESELIRVTLLTDGPGVVSHEGRAQAFVNLHVGRPVRLACHHGTQAHEGLALHGDIDVVPAGVSARWEMKEPDTALLLAISPRLLKQTAEELNIDPNRVELRDRFRARDAHIEHIGWALRAEAEQGFPQTRLYLDSLATALAVRLVQSHSSVSESEDLRRGRLSATNLRLVLEYIEDHLHEDLRLFALAAVIGISASHLKVLFRGSVGLPIHQYVIRRRVDRAALLLEQSRLPISQIAIDTGFAHQSHLSFHMRRVVGLSPRQFRRLRVPSL
jgi:AraC family transcriptional regulator